MSGLDRIEFPATFEQFWLDIRNLIEEYRELKTLDHGKPNWFKVEQNVILVKTMKSSPKWIPISKEIFQKIYAYLSKPEVKEVKREFLLKSLKIYRSSAVCTLLSKLDYIEPSIKPITLKLRK